MRIPRSDTCEVCGDVVGQPGSRGKPRRVCRAADCRLAARQIEQASPATASACLRRHQDRIKRNRQANALGQARLEQQAESEAGEDLQIRSATLPQTQASTTRTVTIQSGTRAYSTPGNGRVKAYSAHLTDIIENANKEFVEPTPGEEAAHESRLNPEDRFRAEPELKILSDHVCRVCEGSCCVHGENTAYLTPHTIRRFMDANPTMTPEDVRQAYLDRVPDESVTDSCINQSPSGCTLPRTMRSDTCNHYYCDGLTEWHEINAEQRGETVLVIQRARKLWRGRRADQNNVVRVAIVETTGAQDVTAAALASIQPADGER